MTLLLLRMPLNKATKEALPPAGLAYHSRKGAVVLDAEVEKGWKSKLSVMLEGRPDTVVEGDVPGGIRERFSSIVSGTAEELIRKASRSGLAPPRWELFPLGMYRAMFSARKGSREVPVWIDGRDGLLEELESNMGMGLERMVFLGKVSGRELSGICRKVSGMGISWVSCLDVRGRMPLEEMSRAGCTHVRKEFRPGESIGSFFERARKLGMKTDAIFFLPERGAARRARLALGCRPDYLAFRASGKRARLAGLMGYGMFYSRPGRAKALKALDLKGMMKAIGTK